MYYIFFNFFSSLLRKLRMKSSLFIILIVASVMVLEMATEVEAVCNRYGCCGCSISWTKSGTDGSGCWVDATSSSNKGCDNGYGKNTNESKQNQFLCSFPSPWKCRGSNYFFKNFFYCKGPDHPQSIEIFYCHCTSAAMEVTQFSAYCCGTTAATEVI